MTQRAPLRDEWKERVARRGLWASSLLSSLFAHWHATRLAPTGLIRYMGLFPTVGTRNSSFVGVLGGHSE